VGKPYPAEPVNLICALLAVREEWLAAATAALEVEFGPTDLCSETWPWEFSGYYAPQMGAPLLRRLCSFRDLVEPDVLASVKLRTNEMEAELARSLANAPARPVNLDPGYVAFTKMVLATTKDAPHRVYLGRGIYAECTLLWRRGEFRPWEWTYADYATEPYREFFARVRALYKGKLRQNRRT